jgi:sn-glycerol 3-phosphate transport system permease protein
LGEGTYTISRETLHAYLLLTPALVLLLAFTHYPAVATLIDSLYTTPRGARPGRWVGWDNYAALLHDPVFFQALRNNALYAAITIPVSVVLALAMALMVNRAIPGRAALRMAYFLPTMLPMIAIANIFLFFYTPDYGLLDQVLGAFGSGRHNWLGDPALALPSLMAVTVWKEAGFFMIFYLAALQSLPPVLREAGALEGAGAWYYMRRVTLPLLMPTTLFVLVNAVVNAFRVVDHVVVMTHGGPDNATTLLLYYVYETGFRFWDTATAATLTVVLLLILCTLAALQFGLFGRRVHYR